MDRDEAIRLLGGGRQGIAEWNRRRGDGETIPDLSGASLSGAGLGGAFLSMADLRWAMLIDANLRGADLHGAEFNGTDLRGADLAECRCRDTVFSAVNLSEVKGLESVRHMGPSTV